MPKLLLSAQDIRIGFGPRTVLNIDRFEIYDGERIGLIGENGAGKTTFLKILSGELMPDGGTVHRHAQVSSIRQIDDNEDFSIGDARLSSEYAAKEWRDGLSGGEKTRRRIAGALSQGAILLADEPTSDLDRGGIERLTRHLKQYEGGVVLVSHDRTLLSEVCTSIAELSDEKLTLFPGNYDDYIEERNRRREFEAFEYEQYRKEHARLRSVIQGKKEQAQSVKLPSRMGNSEARLHRRSATEVEEKLHKTRKALQTRLEQLEVKERPRDDPGIRMALGTYTKILSRVALEIRGMNMRFSENVLLENAECRVPVFTKTALIGPNGCGKTTMIRKIVSGDPRIRQSPGVKIGFFGQDHADVLDFNKTALQNVLENSVYDQSDVRTVLARLNMRGDDVFKPVSVLSGGERAKVALARLFVSEINLLILDEPTNHLDIYSLEALERVLSEYGGTLLLVSHDRSFLSAVATRLVFFEDKKLKTYEGNLSEYEAQKGKSASENDAHLQITALEMRMAALASRMSSPKKGDHPEALMEEYDKIAGQWRALKNDV